MDLLIAPNTVSLAEADIAPITGTPGYATDGNPTTGSPRTSFPAYAWNAIQIEFKTVIEQSGIALNRRDNTQLYQAIQKLVAAGESEVAVGFTPVEQGGNNGLTSDKVNIGNSSNGLSAYISGNFWGIFASQDWANGKFQTAGDYATNPALNTETAARTSADTNLQNQVNDRVLKTGDIMTGTLTVSTHSGSDVQGQLRWGGYLSGSIAGYTYNNYSLYMCEIAGVDPYADLEVNFIGVTGSVGRTDFTFHGISGRIGTPLGQVAVMSDLPLPVGMHVQLFDVTIPQGTNIGNGTDPFVANLPRGFSNFVSVVGNDVGNSIYTVACAVRNGAQVNLWVQSPQHTGGGLGGAVVVQLIAFGYY